MAKKKSKKTSPAANVKKQSFDIENSPYFIPIAFLLIFFLPPETLFDPDSDFDVLVLEDEALQRWAKKHASLKRTRTNTSMTRQSENCAPVRDTHCRSSYL